MHSSIPVFIINLPQSADRKDFMQAQCEHVGISPIFIDAVHGKELSKSEISQHCNQEKAQKLFGRELLLGEIGCALSHKKIYQKMIDENIPYAVVLEDDAVIKEDFIKTIESILASNASWELTLLGHNKGFDKGFEFDSIRSYWGSVPLNDNFILGRIAKGGLGAFGYIVSNDGAKKLLDYLSIQKIIFPIDKITSNAEIVDIYGLFPSIVTVDLKFESVIEGENLRDNDRQYELVYKIAKLMKQTPLFNLTQKMWFTALKVKPIKKRKY